MLSERRRSTWFPKYDEPAKKMLEKSLVSLKSSCLSTGTPTGSPGLRMAGRGRSKNRNWRRSHHTELGTRSRLFLRTHSHVKIFCLGMGWCPKDPPKMAKTAFRLGRRSRSIQRGNEKVQRPSMCLPFCSTSSAPNAVASTCLRPLAPIHSGESLATTPNDRRAVVQNHGRITRKIFSEPSFTKTMES